LHTDWNVIKETLRELLLDGSQVREAEIGTQQAHAAVDIEPDAAGRHDRVVERHVECGHVTDREAVAAVNVGHAHRVADDTGQ